MKTVTSKPQDGTAIAHYSILREKQNALNQARETLLKFGSYDEVIDTLNTSLYAIIEDRLGLSFRQRDTVVCAHSDMTSLLKRVYESRFTIRDDDYFGDNAKGYSKGLDLLFAAYMTSDLVSSDAPDKTRIYFQFKSIKALIKIVIKEIDRRHELQAKKAC